MKRSLVVAALAIAALPLSIAAVCSNADTVSASVDAAEARRVEERFAIRFCYAQYRGQSDVLRCLAERM